MSKIREENPIIEVVEQFPWLNNSIHRVGDFGLYINELSKENEKNDLHLHRYICFSTFDIKILNYIQEGFLELTLRVLSSGQLIWTAVFQPNNYTFLVAAIGTHPATKKPVVSLEVHMASIEQYCNFLKNVAEFVFEEKTPNLGFVS